MFQYDKFISENDLIDALNLSRYNSTLTIDMAGLRTKHIKWQSPLEVGHLNMKPKCSKNMFTMIGLDGSALQCR